MADEKKKENHFSHQSYNELLLAENAFNINDLRICVDILLVNKGYR